MLSCYHNYIHAAVIINSAEFREFVDEYCYWVLAFWFRWLNLNKTSFSPSYSDNSQLTTQLIYNMPPLPPPPPPSIMVARAAASSMPSRTATRVHFAMRLCWPSTIPLKILSVVSCSSGP